MSKIFAKDEKVKNVRAEIVDDILTVTIDLTKQFGLSSSKKSNIIATTSGNKDIGKDGIKLGINCYIPV